MIGGMNMSGGGSQAAVEEEEEWGREGEGKGSVL